MPKLLTLTALVLVVTAAACSEPAERKIRARQDAANVADQMTRGAREIFEIDLPAKCQIESLGPKLDFEVFDITCDGVPYGGVYAGNYPDTSVPRARTIETGMGWPAKIQAWSAEVPAHQADADRIAASLRLRRKS